MIERPAAPTVLTSILRGKLGAVDGYEDLLTAAAFGTLSWLPPSVGLIPFLRFLQPRVAWLEEVVAVDVQLWPWWELSAEVDGAEPDAVLLLRFADDREALLVMEAKWNASKSGHGERDQLMRQYLHGQRRASELGVGFCGLVYLTAHVSRPDRDLEASEAALADRGVEAPHLYWLSWRDLSAVLPRAMDTSRETEPSTMCGCPSRTTWGSSKRGAWGCPSCTSRRATTCGPS